MAVSSTTDARHLQPRRDRWLKVGRSAQPDARAAGREAAAVAGEGGGAKLLIVFCSDAYDLDELLAGIGEAAPGVPLVGCSTAGEIATGGPEDNSVVVVVLGGPGFSVSTAAAPNASADVREAGAVVAQAARAVAGCEHRVLMLLSDGLAGDQQEIVRGAYGVVGAAIGADAPFGIGVHHGRRRVGEPMVATRSAGNRVYVLDDQPALDVDLDRPGAPAEGFHDQTLVVLALG